MPSASGKALIRIPCCINSADSRTATRLGRRERAECHPPSPPPPPPSTLGRGGSARRGDFPAWGWGWGGEGGGRAPPREGVIPPRERVSSPGKKVYCARGRGDPTQGGGYSFKGGGYPDWGGGYPAPARVFPTQRRVEPGPGGRLSRLRRGVIPPGEGNILPGKRAAGESCQESDYPARAKGYRAEGGGLTRPWWGLSRPGGGAIPWMKGMGRWCRGLHGVPLVARHRRRSVPDTHDAVGGTGRPGDLKWTKAVQSYYLPFKKNTSSERASIPTIGTCQRIHTSPFVI